MGRTLSERAAPRWPQINRPYTLSADEKQRLTAIKDVYPHLEFTTTRREMNMLTLLRWEFGKTKDL